MTKQEAIEKIIPILKKIQRDIDTISELINDAIEDSDRYAEKDLADYVAKISEEWEDELTDAKTLLNNTSEIILLDDDPGNAP